VKEFTRDRRGDGPLSLPAESSGLDRVHVLSVLLALGMVAYLAVEPTQNWLLLLLSGLAAIAADSVVRHHPKANFTSLDDTALFLFVPVLFTLGLGIFLEEVVGGYETIGIGMLSVIPYWAILRAEYESIDRASPNYQSTRLVLNIATYVVAFLFFATIYDFELDLATSSFAAGVVSILLAIEVLREEGLDTTRTLLYAVAIGGLVGEAAWTTHFLPLEGSGAAVFLLLAFYLMTGLMHNYLGDRLTRKTAGEFAGVACLGVLIVIFSHLTN
jgi:hypothetical protein